MKKNHLLSILAIFIASFTFAQTGFNYKALITDNNTGNAHGSQAISIRFTIIETIPGTGSTTVYQETHTATTDANGIVSVNIGEGTVVSGDFLSVNWGSRLGLKVEIDSSNGYQDFGTNPLKWVPTAKYASKAGSVDFNSITNVPAGLSDGDDDTHLTDAEIGAMGYIKNPNDADHDPTNELQDLTLNDTQLAISNGNNINFTGWDTNAADDFSGDYTNLTNKPDVFRIQGTNDAATSYSDDIKHGGELFVGTPYASDGFGFTSLRINRRTNDETSYGVVSVIGGSGTQEHYGGYFRLGDAGNGSQYGVRSSITNTGDGSHSGTYISLNGSGSGKHQGVFNSLSGAGTGAQYGVNTYISNTGNASHYANYSYLNGTGSGWHYASYNVLTGTGTGSQIGVNNNIDNSGDAYHYGVRSILSGAGSGKHYGSYNTMAGNGTGNQIGSFNEISNGGTGIHYGVFNDLKGSSNGLQYGTRNLIENNGSDRHYGTYNELTGTGTGKQYGIHNYIYNTGDNAHYGSYSLLTGGGSGTHYGSQNELSGTGTGMQLGVDNEISNSGDASHFGVYSGLSGSGSGEHFANYNELNGAGTGKQYGVVNMITNTGNADHYGSYSVLSGSGTGNKYGTYAKINSGAGGTHYAIYGEAKKSGSYAGYFDGDVKITQKLKADISGDADMKAYIYGNIKSDGTKILSGSSDGYNINRTGTGVYEVTFANAMPDTFAYTVIATMTNNLGFIIINQINTTTMDVLTYDISGNPYDQAFNFVVYKK